MLLIIYRQMLKRSRYNSGQKNIFIVNIPQGGILGRVLLHNVRSGNKSFLRKSYSQVVHELRLPFACTPTNRSHQLSGGETWHQSVLCSTLKLPRRTVTPSRSIFSRSGITIRRVVSVAIRNSLAVAWPCLRKCCLTNNRQRWN